MAEAGSIEQMKEIGKLLLAQDNRATADPIFEVRDTGRCGVERIITCSFSEQMALDYIDANRHNLKKPTTYASSLYRNYEMIAIRRFLMDLAR